MIDSRALFEPIGADSMKTAFRQSCILGCVAVLYIANRLVIRECTSHTLLGPFFNGYFNDLLAPSALLALSNIIFSLRGFWVAKPLPVLAITAFAGMCWEYLAPMINPASVTDPLDLVVYFAGGFAYIAVVGRWRGRTGDK